MAQHVALFVPSLSGGGAERVMLNLACVFADRGIKVDLVLAQAGGDYLSQVPETVRIFDLRARRIVTSLPALVRYLRRERPHAMLSALSHANIVAVWARRLSRVNTRLIVSEHNTLSVTSSNATTWRGRFMPALMRRSYPNADEIVTVSSGVADDLANTIGLPRQHILVIYNPVVTRRMLEMSQESLKHAWFGEDQPPVVLSVGRLTAQKDYSTLIKAFARVRQTTNVRLLILGEGEDRQQLEQLIKDLNLTTEISLPGFVSNPYSYMRAAGVFVLSSRWEGLPTVLIEAMACGTPVISTDCPSGPVEILENGRWGSIVPMENVEALAIEIDRVVTSKYCSSREVRVQDFSDDTIGVTYLDTLLPK